VDIKKNASGDATELEKFLSTQQARRSVEQTLLAEKTVQKLVEIAQGSTGKGKVKKVKTEEGKDG
jgi:DNA transposition AAA+ family ATPase